MKFEGIWFIFLVKQIGLHQILDWLEVANLVLKEGDWKCVKENLKIMD